MKKTILFCVVAAFFAFNLSALDITTKDGKVYRNVEVTNVMPDAVGFMYSKADGTMVLRDVELSDLTKDLQKKFNYSPKKATKFKKQVAKFQAERARIAQKRHQEDLKLFRQHKKVSKELDHIKAVLKAHGIKCWFHIVRAIGQDCIAKVTMPVSSTKFGNLGTVYIRNLTGSQNARIGATIYPTNETKSFQDGIFPVYEGNLNKYALKILNQKEKKLPSTLPSAPAGKDLQFPGNPPQKKSVRK
jgi:hypothetical protein